MLRGTSSMWHFTGVTKTQSRVVLTCFWAETGLFWLIIDYYQKDIKRLMRTLNSIFCQSRINDKKWNMYQINALFRKMKCICVGYLSGELCGIQFIYFIQWWEEMGMRGKLNCSAGLNGTDFNESKNWHWWQLQSAKLVSVSHSSAALPSAWLYSGEILLTVLVFAKCFLFVLFYPYGFCKEKKKITIAIQIK